MKMPEFMDRQIAGNSRSWSDDFSDYDDDDSVSPRFTFHSTLGGSDIRAVANARSSDLSEAVIVLVDQRMKEQTGQVLHAVEAISAQLAQLERRTRLMEGAIDGLKKSLGNYHGITYGKLKELDSLLREVQSCTLDVRDKQDITLAQIQLTKLQISKGKEEPPHPKSNAQTSLSQETSQQPCVPPPPPPPPHVSPDMPHPNPLASAVIPPSISQQQVFYYPPPPPAPASEIYQPFPHYLQVPPTLPQLTPPQMPQQPHQPFSTVHPNTTLSFSIPPNDFSYTPPPQPQNVSPSANPPPFQRSESSSFPAFHYQQSMNEHYYGSPPPFHPQPPPPYPPRESNYDNNLFYHYGSLSDSNPAVEISQLPPPAARLLPHALPIVNSESSSSSSSGENRNRTPTDDDVVEKVVAMGFRRDLVRATVRRMTDKGKPVDPNVILDILTNNGGEEAQIYNDRPRR